MNFIKRTILLLGLLTMLLSTASCDESLRIDPVDTEAPEITGFSPNTGQIGTMVSIRGRHLRDVTEIKIGGVAANVVRVNRTLVMAEITKDNLSGPIEVTSPYGTTVADGFFTVEYLRPTVTSCTEKTSVFGTMEIRGSNLDLVNEISFGGQATVTKSNFELQSEDKIELLVPYYKSEGAVSLHFRYNYGVEPAELVVENAFTLDATAPEVAGMDASALIGSSFTITGSNLNVIEKLILGGSEINFRIESPERIIGDIPGNFTAADAQKVEIVCFAGNIRQEIGTIDIREAPCYIWKNVTLYGPDNPRVNFFGAKTGKYYTPDEFEANAPDIHLAFIGQANGLTFPSLYNANTINTRWKTSAGATISGANAVAMRFRRLKETDPVDAKYIRMINDGTFEYFDAETARAEGLNMTTMKQVMRHKDETDTSGGSNGLPYNISNDEGLAIGGINLIMVVDRATSKEVQEIGFMKLVSVDRAAAADQTASAVVEVYFQKKR